MRVIWRFELAAALAVALAAGLPGGAFAQFTVPNSLPNPNDPSVALSNNLKILAQNPYDVDALLAAGKGALSAGDPNAAIGFLARAEELSPRNAKVKAALGSALVQVERPQEALRMFSEAVALGVADVEIAGDRALAADLQGDSRLAQRDYAVAMKFGRTDEIIRRYALSLGISGEKEKAVDLLDPLTKRGDQAAWRAKAFVLAMNGDIGGADRIVGAVMPPQMAGIMSPFLRRLPALNQAQRARAVNFGTMPSASAVSLAVVDPGDSFRPISGIQTAALSPTRVIAVAPPGEAVKPKETASERRKREKQERELAKLAERARKENRLPGTRPPALPQPPQVALPQPTLSQPSLAQPSPQQPVPVRVAVTQPTVARPPVSQPPISQPVVAQPNQSPRLPAQTPTPVIETKPPALPTSPRLGARIGDVDPKTLEPYLGPSVGGASPASKVVVVDGARTLPGPTGSLPSILPPASSPSAAVVPQPRPSPNVQSPTPSAVISTPVLLPPAVLPPGPRVIGGASEAQVPSTQPPLVGEAVKPAQGVLPTAASSTPPSTPSVLPPVPTASAPAATPVVTAPVPDPVKLATALPSPSTAVPAVTSAPPTSTSVASVPASGPATAPLISGLAPPIAGGSIAPASSKPVDPPVQPVASATIGPASLPSTPSASLPNPTETAEPGSALTPEPKLALDPAGSPVTSEMIKSVEVIKPVVAAPEVPKAAEPEGLAAIVAGLDVEEQSSSGPIPTEDEFRAKQLAAKRKEEADRLAAEKEARLKAETARESAKAAADLAAKEKLDKEKAAAELKAKQEAKEEAAERKSNPARVWVQVATGANRGGLPFTWRKLKTDAPKALEGLSAYIAPFRATNRLLVGPFKSAGEARAVINRLSKEGVFASLFASEAGQEVSRLGGR